MPGELAELQLHEKLDAILARLDAIEAKLEKIVPDDRPADDAEAAK